MSENMTPQQVVTQLNQYLSRMVACVFQNRGLVDQFIGDAVMAQVNSLTDIFSKLPPANTGNLAIDILLQCAQDNAGVQIEAKLSPLAGLAPLMGLVSIIAELAAIGK